eukprot:1177687-Prorocentrum_minimum.AAC.2
MAVERIPGDPASGLRGHRAGKKGVCRGGLREGGGYLLWVVRGHLRWDGVAPLVHSVRHKRRLPPPPPSAKVSTATARATQTAARAEGAVGELREESGVVQLQPLLVVPASRAPEGGALQPSALQLFNC